MALIIQNGILHWYFPAKHTYNCAKYWIHVMLGATVIYFCVFGSVELNILLTADSSHICLTIRMKPVHGLANKILSKTSKDISCWRIQRESKNFTMLWLVIATIILHVCSNRGAMLQPRSQMYLPNEGDYVYCASQLVKLPAWRNLLGKLIVW